MYTLLTSFPAKGCGNVGDTLIEEALKDILKRERGEEEFLTLFREDDLTPHLAAINRSKAVLLCGFPIRDVPMYPGVYRLTPKLSDITVPLIPIASNWNVYPGDFYDRGRTRYSAETVNFLHYIARQQSPFPVREHFTARMLKKHGVEKTLLTGCPSWYAFPHMGQPMRRPEHIRRLVFTPPMSYCYADQAVDVLRMLAQTFPQAERICCFFCGDCKTNPLPEGELGDNSVAMNPEVAAKNERIRHEARNLGFEVVSAAFDIRNLDFLDGCDLHVGYDCHGNLSCLRRRIPSVMIAEDARGVGFSYTLGLPEFNGFTRCQYPTGPYVKPANTSGYCDSLAAYSVATADASLPQRIGEFLEEQVAVRWTRFAGVADIIDTTWKQGMQPFIQALP